MSQKDLLRELKSTIKELSEEKDDLLTKLKSKESRIKQVLIQLEQSVDDVAHCGKKIREQEEEIKELTQEVKNLKQSTEPDNEEQTTEETKQETQED
jgi:septal ring factor EnvC (AmiA/AmiB activator)